jgi:integrating conjugative element protein (TIGR03756 family)
VNNKRISTLAILCVVMTAMVGVAVSSTRKINTLQIEQKIASHVLDYSHFKLIGACLWTDVNALGVPNLYFTAELDEYLPDLIVSSFNNNGDDPWTSARVFLDKPSYSLANKSAKTLYGFSLGNGKIVKANDGSFQANSLITKSVDVVGNPYILKYVPFPTLKLDTKGLEPYYSSTLDIPGRFGIAESLRIIDDANIFSHIIGKSFIDKWGYEFPRSMTSNTTNDYKASVMAALRAADIVTNKNTLHVVISTNNSCGTNCRVASVTEDKTDKNAIWQEVYPIVRHINIGESSKTVSPGHSLGEKDEKAGSGNYVFVVWRHYRGCVQQSGKFLGASISVAPTEKR